MKATEEISVTKDYCMACGFSWKQHEHIQEICRHNQSLAKRVASLTWMLDAAEKRIEKLESKRKKRTCAEK
jgi:hypothetical protein